MQRELTQSQGKHTVKSVVYIRDAQKALPILKGPFRTVPIVILMPINSDLYLSPPTFEGSDKLRFKF